MFPMTRNPPSGHPAGPSLLTLRHLVELLLHVGHISLAAAATDGGGRGGSGTLLGGRYPLRRHSWADLMRDGGGRGALRCPPGAQRRSAGGETLPGRGACYALSSGAGRCALRRRRRRRPAEGEEERRRERREVQVVLGVLALDLRGGWAV